MILLLYSTASDLSMISRVITQTFNTFYNAIKIDTIFHAPSAMRQGTRKEIKMNIR